MVEALLVQRATTGQPSPRLVERNIETDHEWQRAYFETIPVLELGDHRIELVTSLAKIRRLFADALD
jgi:hypothetical protein